MMIKKFLSKKTGVTLLEGLIAIALLALVASGTFGVLLSVSRKSDQPDRREDMIYAIEGLNDLLKSAAYYMHSNTDKITNTDIKNALCQDDQPLKAGEHTVDCLLPKSCDSRTSTFKYTVSSKNIVLKDLPGIDKSVTFQNAAMVGSSNPTSSDGKLPGISITYNLVCNGYSL